MTDASYKKNIPRIYQTILKKCLVLDPFDFTFFSLRWKRFFACLMPSVYIYLCAIFISFAGTLGGTINSN